MPRVDVIVVAWNSGTRVDRCLGALAAADRTGFTLDRVVVVDNASDPPYQAGTWPELPPITLVANTHNRGFAEACDQGAVGSRAEYLLFLNPDTRVAPDALARAIAALDGPGHEQTGILGLPLVNDLGDTQATCGRFLTVSRIFNQLTGLALLAPAWCQGFRMTDWDHRGTRRVDYVSGACLLTRRALFEALDGFDRRFVVYLEDADLALRAREQGWDTVYLAGPAVYHEGGWGTGRARGLRLSHAWRSLLAYGHKHFGPARACAVAAMVLGLAPVARIGQALLHGSGRQVVDAVIGYGRLWQMLSAEAFVWRRHRAPVETTPPADAAGPSKPVTAHDVL